MRLIQFSRKFALGFRHSFDSLERALAISPDDTPVSRLVWSGLRATHPPHLDQTRQA
jgi:hypothetical protein